MFETVNTIVFDLDGTLLNTDELIICSYRKVFKTFKPNYKLSYEEELSFLGPPLKEMFSKYFTDDFNLLLKTYHDYASKNILNKVSFFPNAEEILNYLKKRNYRLILFTSRFQDSCEEMLDSFNMKKYFDKIITLNDVNNPKPSPEGIELIKKTYNLKNNQILFIGDSKTDYEAGKNGGVYTGLVAWKKGIDFTKYQMDILINDFNELKEIF